MVGTPWTITTYASDMWGLTWRLLDPKPLPGKCSATGDLRVQEEPEFDRGDGADWQLGILGMRIPDRRGFLSAGCLFSVLRSARRHHGFPHAFEPAG
jgi:hypothetical protein